MLLTNENRKEIDNVNFTCPEHGLITIAGETFQNFNQLLICPECYKEAGLLKTYHKPVKMGRTEEGADLFEEILTDESESLFSSTKKEPSSWMNSSNLKTLLTMKKDFLTK